MGSGSEKFYQILVAGRTVCFDDPHKIHSKTIFRTREEAEAAVESFKVTCTTPASDKDWWYLNPDCGIVVKIMELEVSGS